MAPQGAVLPAWRQLAAGWRGLG